MSAAVAAFVATIVAEFDLVEPFGYEGTESAGSVCFAKNSDYTLTSAINFGASCILLLIHLEEV